MVRASCRVGCSMSVAGCLLLVSVSVAGMSGDTSTPPGFESDSMVA